MPNLTAIPEQNFEKARDYIATILADEFSINPVDGVVPSVYTERIAPIDKVNMPAVNIVFAQANNALLDNRTNKYEYIFNIDCYASGKVASGNRAGTNSSIDLHRLVAIVKQVLLNPVYNTLLFQNGEMGKRMINQIQVAEPFQKTDANSTTMARLQYQIELTDSMQSVAPEIAAQSTTKVNIAETDSGYLWTISQ